MECFYSGRRVIPCCSKDIEGRSLPFINYLHSPKGQKLILIFGIRDDDLRNDADVSTYSTPEGYLYHVQCCRSNLQASLSYYQAQWILSDRLDLLWNRRRENPQVLNPETLAFYFLFLFKYPLFVNKSNNKSRR